MKRKIRVLSLFLGASILFSSVHGYADFKEEAEARKSWPIQSNQIENWPEGPAIGAGSAILMDADSGLILYEKNIHEHMFPASTTKLMTCILAMEKENVSLSDMVYFSEAAVMSIPPDGSNMGIDVGNEMTLEECLYGILVCSANEISNAVGEYVSGSDEKFVKLMNERAKELGCLDTHFTNAHGYTDPDHYTSAYDLALMGREFFKNELLSKISRTLTYHWYPTPTQPDDMLLSSRNYFIAGYYDIDGLVGSKTGFTDESRQCLVTCCERNGIRLICVIMQEETPYQYEDTLALFNYGYNNFEKINISDYETNYTIQNENFFSSESDVFGDSSPIIFLDTTSTLLIPKTVQFNNLTSKISFAVEDKDHLAQIDYEYNGKFLGNGYLSFSETKNTSDFFNETAFSDSDDGVTNRNAPEEIKEEEEPTFIYVNNIVFWIVVFLSLLLSIFIVRKIFSNYNFAKRRQSIIQKNRLNSSIDYKPYEISKKSRRKRKW